MAPELKPKDTDSSDDLTLLDIDLEEACDTNKHLSSDGDKEGSDRTSSKSKGAFYLKTVFCALGMITGFIFCFVELGGDRKINQTVAITIWMATLWLTEVVPLVVTAFLPIVLFPLFGILKSSDVTAQYANNVSEQAKRFHYFNY